MSDSVQKLAIARLMTNLEALKASSVVRDVKRGRARFQATQFPSLQIVIGDDVPAEEPEDTRGYTLNFPVEIDIHVADYIDRAGALDDLIPQVQVAIEADLTLNNLVTWIKYRGNQLFVNAENSPSGGMTLFYEVQYRRERGAPQTGY